MDRRRARSQPRSEQRDRKAPPTVIQHCANLLCDMVIDLEDPPQTAVVHPDDKDRSALDQRQPRIFCSSKCLHNYMKRHRKEGEGS